MDTGVQAAEWIRFGLHSAGSVLDTAVCGPIPCTLNILAIWCTLLFALLWLIMLSSRERLVESLKERMVASNAQRVDIVLDSPTPPPISIVVHLKEACPTILNLLDGTFYAGATDIVLVADTDKCTAYKTMTRLLRQHQPARANITTKLRHAGLSWHNSQTTHCQLYGVSQTNPASSYVLFVDEDIVPHPSTISTLVAAVHDDPTVFASTGMAFQCPVRHSPFAAYLLLAYRIINMSAFTTERPAFAWGGCLLLRRHDVATNMYALCDAMRDGCSSLDMAISHVCRRSGRSIAAPATAVYATALHRMSFRRYIRLLSSQMFNLGTRSQASFDRLQNLLQTTLFQLMPVLFSVPIWAIPFETVYLVVRFGVFSSPLDLLRSRCLISVVGMIGVVLTGLLAVAIAVRLVIVYTALANLLGDPEHPLHPRVPFPRFLLAIVLHLAICPVISIRLLITHTVTLSGVRYHRDGGRIAGVYRPEIDPTSGKIVNWRTRPWRKSLELALMRDHEVGLLTPPSLPESAPPPRGGEI